MRTRTLFAAFALLATTAACTVDPPTAAVIEPSDVRQSGVGFGSGNVPGDVPGTTTTTLAADSGSTAPGRGVGFGSGN
jgi:hypothetical protein